MKNTLQKIYEKHGLEGDVGHADKGNIHSYIPVYEELLKPYRESATVLEIGLAFGYSLRMWDEYFGDEAKIFGADILVAFDPIEFKSPRVTILEVDATTSELLTKLNGTKFDVVIDDGSHQAVDQINTFNLLRESMNPGGVYIVEDILDFDSVSSAFKSLHANCDVIDLRSVKNRFDDALIVLKF
jgi:23S rRNA U2552 (ribose-2'-O)-methylase RlmE/FtsJ